MLDIPTKDNYKDRNVRKGHGLIGLIIRSRECGKKNSDVERKNKILVCIFSKFGTQAHRWIFRSKTVQFLCYYLMD